MTIWVVIGIVVIALLAFFALSRPATTENALQNGAATSEEAVDRAAIRTEAAADLTALRVRAEAGETYEDLRDDFAQVRARVAAAYENAEGATAEEWNEIRAEFDELETSARAGTSNFLDSLSHLIAHFSADVRTETAGE